MRQVTRRSQRGTRPNYVLFHPVHGEEPTEKPARDKWRRAHTLLDMLRLKASLDAVGERIPAWVWERVGIEQGKAWRVRMGVRGVIVASMTAKQLDHEMQGGAREIEPEEDRSDAA